MAARSRKLLRFALWERQSVPEAPQTHRGPPPRGPAHTLEVGGDPPQGTTPRGGGPSQGG
eukprot:7228510-Pyramimonas_sp.AAC.1